MFNWSFDSISSKSLLNGVTDVLPRGPKLLSATIKKENTRKISPKHSKKVNVLFCVNTLDLIDVVVSSRCVLYSISTFLRSHTSPNFTLCYFCSWATLNFTLILA